MINRLKEDHERASQLAKGLSLIEGIQLDKGSPKTNMVYIKFDPSLNLDADTCAVRLGEQGIKVGITGLRHFRLVCHYWISDDDIPKIINAFREALKKVKMIPQES